MKKKLLILMTVTGMIILLGGLLTYGLGVHEIIPVPRPDLIVVGTSLIGILLIVSGVCDLFVKKTDVYKRQGAALVQARAILPGVLQTPSWSVKSPCA